MMRGEHLYRTGIFLTLCLYTFENNPPAVGLSETKRGDTKTGVSGLEKTNIVSTVSGKEGAGMSVVSPTSSASKVETEDRSEFTKIEMSTRD